MSKSGKMGMELHQALSFSSFMMRVPRAEAVFWPGCALMNLDGALLEKTLEILRRREPEMALCTCCCGQPSVYLFPEQAEKRQTQLLSLLKERGVKRIYTACPNCTLQLKELGLEVQSIWPLLAELLSEEEILPLDEKLIWHDPCPTRKDPLQQDAVRKLLMMSGCDWIEPEHCREKAICCGNYHMMHSLKPDVSAEMRSRRLAEFPMERSVASSCEGCLGAFRSEGRSCLHLLELLFGKSEKRSWLNRIQTTMKQK